MMRFSIRFAARDELYDVAVFLDECWRKEYGGIVENNFLDSLSVDTRYRRLLNRFDEKSSDFLVMTDGNKIIGAAVFGKSYTDGYLDDGEISAIYLGHDYIGKGYGHALFTRAEEILVQKGYNNFVLDVLASNTRAVSFYQKHGYEKVDKRTVRLGTRDYPLTVFRKKNDSY
ncbi:MAG TPA: hypothetical protein DEQ02_09950 [Ruminococcaceae bacterium]|nr:hypothetical protein [Oscillospiraceae bacterium]